MKKLRAGIIGATGMVGQRLALLLSKHEWFEPVLLAASQKSKGKAYCEAVGSRWAMQEDIPPNLNDLVLYDACETERISREADLVFIAVDMDKEKTMAMEESFAKAECPVISNNSAHRSAPDVPMIIPELNDSHASVIESQRKRLNTKRGFIAVKSNCSIQSYVPMLFPLHYRYSLKKVIVCTCQAISGAGKTLSGCPEITDNIMPFIRGEEEKCRAEPLKIFGNVAGGAIVPSDLPEITARCLRVPVSDGHLAVVFASFKTEPDIDEIKDIWRNFSGAPQNLSLPSAPKRFIHYFGEPDRPQVRLDRDLENGMAVSAGRLRREGLNEISFIGLSHNTLRGAAGGAVLLAELLFKKGFIVRKEERG
ncbi:MAG: Aspartate-semialdehyde dehydrogenase [Firmicutes bacterium ADurb.Bin182]|nr:MAG: Aspartate-semialdehyde dehydrogenase [Firmicutes bacterium ADurb.Bin182]